MHCKTADRLVKKYMNKLFLLFFIFYIIISFQIFPRLHNDAGHSHAEVSHWARHAVPVQLERHSSEEHAANMPAGHTEALGRADHSHRRPDHSHVHRHWSARCGLLWGDFECISHAIFVKFIWFEITLVW